MTNDMIYKFQDFLGIERQNPFTILEAKATESKTTKEVNEKEVAGYDYKTNKNLNNQIFDQYINGLRFEMEKDPELLANDPSEALLKAKDVVAKNLEKDPLFYMKNAAFGIDGLGYTELENGKEPTGKYKSSGYGDLKENNMNKSEKLVELLEEAVAGIPSIGNPFAERKNQAYEDKFAAFLAEEKEEKKETKEAINLSKNDTPQYKATGSDKKGGNLKDKLSKKEGKKKQPKDVVAEIEKVAEMAGNYVKMKEYQKKISELKETYTSISEDENLQEFIDESKTKSLQEEIALYEKYCNEATEAYEYSKNNK